MLAFFLEGQPRRHCEKELWEPLEITATVLLCVVVTLAWGFKLSSMECSLGGSIGKRTSHSPPAPLPWPP